MEDRGIEPATGGVGPDPHNADSGTIENTLNHSTNVTLQGGTNRPENAENDSLLIVPKLNPDANPAALTALLRHQNGTDLPADLAAIVKAWPKLPENIKAAVLALVSLKG